MDTVGSRKKGVDKTGRLCKVYTSSNKVPPHPHKPGAKHYAAWYTTSMPLELVDDSSENWVPLKSTSMDIAIGEADSKGRGSGLIHLCTKCYTRQVYSLISWDIFMRKT